MADETFSPETHRFAEPRYFDDFPTAGRAATAISWRMGSWWPPRARPAPASFPTWWAIR